MELLPDEPAIARTLRTGYPHPEAERQPDDSLIERVELSEDEFQDIIQQRWAKNTKQQKGRLLS